MISMRYARNLAHGFGLVWNPGGPRVEGFTNPLWVLFMSVFHLFPISTAKMSLCVEISGAFFLLLGLLYVKKVARALCGNSRIVYLGAVFLTAFYLPLNNWGLQGMEVSILALIVTAAVWGAIRCFEEQRVIPWLYPLLGVATLVRPDLFVAFLAILVFMVGFDRERWREHLSRGLFFLACFAALQTAFRMLYYGHPLPNTYYLKMTGYPVALRVIRGLSVYLTFIWKMNWVLFMLPFAALLFRRDRQLLLLAWVFAAQSAYSIYVGGDAWETWGGSNRYLCIVMPLFFILFCIALGEIGSSLSTKFLRDNLRPRYRRYAAFAAILLSFWSFNAIDGTASLQKWFLATPPLETNWQYERVKMALAVKTFTDQQATIAVFAAGAIPYFSERPALDLLGKCDAKIAHEPARVHPGDPEYTGEFTGFHPGHMKRDYAYSIGELKPDLIVEPPMYADEIEPYLHRFYQKVRLGEHNIYCLRGSSHISWKKLQPAGAKQR